MGECQEAKAASLRDTSRRSQEIGSSKAGAVGGEVLGIMYPNTRSEKGDVIGQKEIKGREGRDILPMKMGKAECRVWGFGERRTCLSRQKNGGLSRQFGTNCRREAGKKTGFKKKKNKTMKKEKLI